ncbi:MAG TPA: cell division protein FtsZ [Methylovirgula sp.]|nr:cell division protein FtsZ [Methylovirgula sp.]
MSINLKAPELKELKPRIMVCGIGGAGGNAVNNMIVSGLIGVDFIVANTDAQALMSSRAERLIQMGLQVTGGLGAGSQPDVGRAAAEEVLEEIRDHLSGAHMVFVTAGMGGGTGTGAAPIIAHIARDLGILTVGVVTKPFQFEGVRRMRVAEAGILELQKSVDTLIVIPNQNLFRVANEKTTFADAFAMADQVLFSGVACITDLMVKEGLINLDFADVRAIMREMGKAMMGTGEASGEKRAVLAAEAAIANPLLDEVSMKGARGLLISITGGNDLTLYEVDEAASRIRQEVDEDANIILGATFDQNLDGTVRVSVVATGIDGAQMRDFDSAQARISEAADRLRAQAPRADSHAQRDPIGQSELQPEIAAHAYPDPAAIAAPPAGAIRGVHLQPVARQAHHYAEPSAAAPRETEPYNPGPFIPPAPESPVVRAQRMLQIEDLPVPAQKQIRAHRGEQPAESHNETKRRTLLERLAAFGVSRHEEPSTPARRETKMPLQVQAPRTAQPNSVHAEYGKRGVAPSAVRHGQQSLDAQGRIVPRGKEEDQLEIPAFLRRQSS